MIIIENVTIYKCEFCSKKLYRKHAMLKHEDLCFNNPKNIKACMNCEFLEKIQINAHWLVGNSEHVDNSKQVDVFRCNKLDKLMFPFSIERRKLHEKFDTYSEQEPMPSKCDEFKSKIEILEIFNF